MGIRKYTVQDINDFADYIITEKVTISQAERDLGITTNTLGRMLTQLVHTDDHKYTLVIDTSTKARNHRAFKVPKTSNKLTDSELTYLGNNNGTVEKIETKQKDMLQMVAVNALNNLSTQFNDYVNGMITKINTSSNLTSEELRFVIEIMHKQANKQPFDWNCILK